MPCDNSCAWGCFKGMFMKLGDLVRIRPEDEDSQGRVSGLIIEIDSHHPDCSNVIIPIAKVAWNTGLGWIDATRLEVVNE